MSVNALKWAALLSCAAAYVAWRGMPETEYTSEGLNMTINAIRWARLFAVVGAIVLVNGMPDNEYMGGDDE
mgnify:CR=1 FL=1